MRRVASLLVLCALAAAAAPLLGPAAAAQAPAGSSPLEIVDVVVPERTVGGERFPVSVTLHNAGSAPLQVSLFGVLYPREPDPASPCGPVKETGGEFTHILQPNFTVAAGETLTFPAAGENEWMHLYTPSQAPAAPGAREFCVFAFEPTREDSLNYYDYESLGLNVRRSNQAPMGDFSWSPQSPTAVEPVVFTATASDADGDPVTFRWDFGHHNVSGRATAMGPQPTHTFYPAGTYTVKLVISDGFAQSVVSHDVQVGPERTDGAGDGGAVDVEPTEGAGSSFLPLPWALTLVAAAVALAARSWRPPAGR